MLKLCTLLTFSSVFLAAADFTTGQGARAVIGQPTFTAQEFGTTKKDRFGGIGGVAFANGNLYATDANRLGLAPNNNRVLLFNGVRNMLPQFDKAIDPFQGRCPVCGGVASVVLGDKDATTQEPIGAITQKGFRQPTAVASEGSVLAVADTNNNRILIWKSLPTVDGQSADVVLGQPNFTTVAPLAITASALRSPQGVWIQAGRLYVADTQNNRILIWNNVAAVQNNQPADMVLGQPNFTTAPPINSVNLDLPAAANLMLSPTSVTSDGTRLIVADLGYNRVLIWSSIPTTNQQAADIVIGQPDFTRSVANNSPQLCTSTGNDTDGKAIYPERCGRTLNFPRYALSDGTRLYVADSGNDRVLVYNKIPTVNAPPPDAILGQPDEFLDVYTSNDNLATSASNLLPTPTSLAWDAQRQDLYIADPTDYRILVYTPATPNLPQNGVVNAASLDVFAAGFVSIGGTIRAKDTVTIKIQGTSYTYTVLTEDTLDEIAKKLVALINGSNSGNGDPNALAYHEVNFATIRLIAKAPGTAGNIVTLETTLSSNAQLTATASGSVLFGGASAAQVAPGALVLLRGTNLADQEAFVDPLKPGKNLPYELGNVQVYIDGIRAPLFKVSPTEIGAQIPFLVGDASSSAAWVRTVRANGSVSVTNAVGVPLLPQNPGIFASPGPEPRAAIALHMTDYATGTMVLGGSSQGGDTGTITVGSVTVSYTAQVTDTLETVRDALIDLINANPNSQVIASAAGLRIRFRSKLAGAAGNLIPQSATVTTLAGNTNGATLSITPTVPVICCYSFAGQPITEALPAVPGETIVVYATGLGFLTPYPARAKQLDGTPYDGTLGTPRSEVTALVGSGGGTVVSANMLKDSVGVYEVQIELGVGLLSNKRTQLTLQQGFTTSNIVTIPVFKGGAEKYVLTSASPSTNGATTFTVSTQDSNGNPVTNYTGSFTVSTTDTAATVPGSITLVNGQGSFDITFKTAGQQNVIVTDTATPSITASLVVTVQPQVLKLVISPQTISAGGTAFYTLTVQDLAGATLTGYSSTFTVLSSDPAVTLPTITLNSGVATFNTVFPNPGIHTIVIVDNATGVRTFASVSVGVTLRVTASAASVAVGGKLTFTATAVNAQGQAIPGVIGATVSTTDDLATYTPGLTLNNGTATFDVTFGTAGSRTVTVTNQPTGVSANVAITVTQ